MPEPQVALEGGDKPMDRAAAFAESPRWGTGTTRRRMFLSAHEGHVEGALEDHRHAMRCTLWHQDGVVTRVESHFHRYTLNLCPGASKVLEELVGMRLDITSKAFFAGGRTRRNCTHMLDLAWLCLRQAARGDGQRTYDIVIPDSREGRMDGELLRDGQQVLRWETRNGQIIAPQPYAGQATLSGFVGWALNRSGLDGDELEAALVLQKGFFLSLGRQFDLPEGPVDQSQHAAVAGACHGYAGETLTEAVRRHDQFRDFTDRPEDLLRFL